MVFLLSIRGRSPTRCRIGDSLIRCSAWCLFFLNFSNLDKRGLVAVDGVFKPRDINFGEVSFIVFGIQAVEIKKVYIWFAPFNCLPKFFVVLIKFINVNRQFSFSDNSHF